MLITPKVRKPYTHINVIITNGVGGYKSAVAGGASDAAGVGVAVRAVKVNECGSVVALDLDGDGAGVGALAVRQVDLLRRDTTLEHTHRVSASPVLCLRKVQNVKQAL